MLRLIGGVLHAIGLVCVTLLLWRLLTPASARHDAAQVSADGHLDLALASALRTAPDTLDVVLRGVPDARARAQLRALRGSGRVLRLSADAPLTAVAATVDEEWRQSGGAHVQIVGRDSISAALSDAAGRIDSAALTSRGVSSRTGPVRGVLRVGVHTATASVSPLGAASPEIARVLVLGDATWESRFVVTALEEAGWPVDVAVSLSPKVRITQGISTMPARSRHSIVVVLPGALSSAIAALPAFVRSGGGLVIVGTAARIGGLAGLRAGTPGSTVAGEVGAEASDDARHGLDLIPIAALAAGAVALESRDGKVAVAARRVGAGRVIQVGYDNSWLWRMAGNDDAPVAHRRWWTALLSGVVPMAAPVSRVVLDPSHDTLEAAPLAALASDLGLPAVRVQSAGVNSRSFVEYLDPRWLLALALLSLVASWTLRRFRGLA